MELTQEYFDKGLDNLLEKLPSKGDLTKLELKLEDKIKAQTVQLQEYTNEAFATQQLWMEERFKELIKLYDVRERVEKLEQEFREFKIRQTV